MTTDRLEGREIDDAIRRWATERHLPDAHLMRWLALAPEDRTALLGVAERLHLRTGQLVVAFEVLEEIAVRERITIATIIASDEIRVIIEGGGSTPGRARYLLDTLRAKRFPRLHRMTTRLANEIAALGLPGGIRVVLPKDLSSDEVRIEICARGGADMLRLIDAVANLRAGLGRIADLTSRADSIYDEV
jgi:predicted NBD/HSP70 family sugar kinase